MGIYVDHPVLDLAKNPIPLGTRAKNWANLARVPPPLNFLWIDSLPRSRPDHHGEPDPYPQALDLPLLRR